MRTGLALTLGVLGLVVAGCNSGLSGDRADARKGGSVLVGLAKAPASLDPAVAADQTALQAVRLAYTPPLTYRHAGGGRGTEIVPALAEGMPTVSADYRTVRFTFRRGLRYSDGRRLQAGDFELAIRRALVLNPRARRALAGVVGVRDARHDVAGITTDQRTRTVRIDLAAPDPNFTSVLASTWAAPVSSGTPTRDLSSAPPAGIGPYRAVRRRRGQVYAFSRRRGFRLANVPAGNVDSVSAVVVPERARRTALALRGRLDLSEGEPPAPRLPQIRSEEKQRYREFPTLASRFVSFDLGRRPFGDQDIRRAVAFALDLQAVARAEEGFINPACNLIPPHVPGYVPADPCPYGPRENDADLVRAAQLVRGSPARKARVVVDGGPGPRAGVLARYGVQTLRKIGLRARVARTPAQARRAQLTFAERDPGTPEPGRYLGVVDDAGVRSDAGALERDAPLARSAPRWAALDRRVVQGALVAPLGVATTGVLLSERLDADNCLTYNPLYGTDLAALCLR